MQQTGPNGGDYGLGLTFRATLANTVDATAFVSIHHNSAPTTQLPHPGSGAHVSAGNPESARLGGLIVEETRTGLARFDADWMGATGEGVFARVGTEGADYYTLLDVSEVPAAIIEGVYISNPTEETLAAANEFQQAYAEAVYRALFRFVTTEDNPIPAPEPEIWDVAGNARSMGDCTVPGPLTSGTALSACLHESDLVLIAPGDRSERRPGRGGALRVVIAPPGGPYAMHDFFG